MPAFARMLTRGHTVRHVAGRLQRLIVIRHGARQLRMSIRTPAAACRGPVGAVIGNAPTRMGSVVAPRGARPAPGHLGVVRCRPHA